MCAGVLVHGTSVTADLRPVQGRSPQPCYDAARFSRHFRGLHAGQRSAIRPRARAGGGRRDAGPLLVRRHPAHLSRSAGAGGARARHRGTSRRCRQRGGEPGEPGRALHACSASPATTPSPTAWRPPWRSAACTAASPVFKQAATITKLRVLSRHQQLIRLDFEESFGSFDGAPLLPHSSRSSRTPTW